MEDLSRLALHGSFACWSLQLDLPLLWFMSHAGYSMRACAGPPAIQSESHINVLVDPPGPFRYLPDFILKSVGEAALKASLSTLQASPTASALLTSHCDAIEGFWHVLLLSVERPFVGQEDCFKHKARV